MGYRVRLKALKEIPSHGISTALFEKKNNFYVLPEKIIMLEQNQYDYLLHCTQEAIHVL